MPTLLPHNSSSTVLAGDRPFRVLLGAGIALLVMGTTDLLLALVPLRIGNTEWEFGTISALLNGLPVPAVGVALVLAAGIALDSVTAIVAALLWCGTATMVLLGCCILYLLDIPLALRAVTEPAMRGPLKSAIVKASVALVTYLALWLFLIYHGARFLRRGA